MWLVIRKKAAPVPNLSIPEAVRAALCYGWIDSTSRSLDGTRSMVWVSPRRKGSWWSETNKRPATRTSRVTQTAERAARGERAHP